MVIPFVHEVETALLHPAGEIFFDDWIGVAEDRAFRIKDGDRGLFDGDAGAAQLRRIGHVVAGVETARIGVVLHHQRAAVTGVIEQALIVLLHVVTSIVSANTENDSAESLQVAARDVFRRKKSHFKTELPQHSGDVVARAHDVANLEAGWDFHVHNGGALNGRLKVEESADVWAGYQAVALDVVRAASSR